MYEDRTYGAILAEAQGQIPDDIQKNEGSLVYNALSALAYEIERLYIEADFILKQTYAATADYEHLKLRAADRGMYPYEATSARMRGEFNVPVPIGARFNLRAYNYVVEEEIGQGAYVLRCEEVGAGPNGLSGALTPITFVEGLETAAITETLIPGRDGEGHGAFYKRYLESFKSNSFAGNVTAYKTYINALSGVGGCRVFPVWKGPGTVKVVVIGSDWNKISDHQVTAIQEEVCPEPGKGYGFAPIDHDVTIASVEEVGVSVTTSIVLEQGYDWASIEDQVEGAIEGYLCTIRKGWGDSEGTTTIYVSRLDSAVLDVHGVVDIQGTMLNGRTGNMILTDEQIPVLREVTAL